MFSRSGRNFFIAVYIFTVQIFSTPQKTIREPNNSATSKSITNPINFTSQKILTLNYRSEASIIEPATTNPATNHGISITSLYAHYAGNFVWRTLKILRINF